MSRPLTGSLSPVDVACARCGVPATATEHLVQGWEAVGYARIESPARWFAWARECLSGARATATEDERAACEAECVELESAIGAVLPPEPPRAKPVKAAPRSVAHLTTHSFGGETLRCRWTHAPGSTYWDLAVLDAAGDVVAVCGYSTDPDDSPVSGRVCVAEDHPLAEALFFTSGGFGWPELPAEVLS